MLKLHISVAMTGVESLSILSKREDFRLHSLLYDGLDLSKTTPNSQLEK
jgi:hypothetical protein